MQEGHTFNNHHLRHFFWGKDLPKKTPSKQTLLVVRGMAQHVSLSYISINAKHRWQYLHYQTKGPIHPITPNRRLFFFYDHLQLGFGTTTHLLPSDASGILYLDHICHLDLCFCWMIFFRIRNPWDSKPIFRFTTIWEMFVFFVRASCANLRPWNKGIPGSR